MECMKGDALLKELEELLEGVEAVSGVPGMDLDHDVDVDRERARLEKIRASLSRYKGHLLRCVLQQEAYNTMMDRVREHADFMFVVVDWK